jgi:hypothetical protein
MSPEDQTRKTMRNGRNGPSTRLRPEGVVFGMITHIDVKKGFVLLS